MEKIRALVDQVVLCFSLCMVNLTEHVWDDKLVYVFEFYAAIMLVGRPFVKRFAVCYGTVVCPVCLSVCNVGILWPNGWIDQDVTWYGGRPRPRSHYARWGPSFPSERGTAPPLFGPRLLWLNGWVIKMPFGTEVGLGQGDIVLDGIQFPPSDGKGHSSPHFSVHVYCGKTVAHLSNCWALVFFVASP